MGTSNSSTDGRYGPGTNRFYVCVYACLILAQGVVICVTSLVMTLAQDHLDAYAVCYQKAVDRLRRVSTILYLKQYCMTNFVASDRTRICGNICLL